MAYRLGPPYSEYTTQYTRGYSDKYAVKRGSVFYMVYPVGSRSEPILGNRFSK